MPLSICAEWSESVQIEMATSPATSVSLPSGVYLSSWIQGMLQSLAWTDIQLKELKLHKVTLEVGALIKADFA